MLIYARQKCSGFEVMVRKIDVCDQSFYTNPLYTVFQTWNNTLFTPQIKTQRAFDEEL